MLKPVLNIDLLIGLVPNNTWSSEGVEVINDESDRFRCFILDRRAITLTVLKQPFRIPIFGGSGDDIQNDDLDKQRKPLYKDSNVMPEICIKNSGDRLNLLRDIQEYYVKTLNIRKKPDLVICQPKSRKIEILYNFEYAGKPAGLEIYVPSSCPKEGPIKEIKPNWISKTEDLVALQFILLGDTNAAFYKKKYKRRSNRR